MFSYKNMPGHMTFAVWGSPSSPMLSDVRVSPPLGRVLQKTTCKALCFDRGCRQELVAEREPVV